MVCNNRMLGYIFKQNVLLCTLDCDPRTSFCFLFMRSLEVQNVNLKSPFWRKVRLFADIEESLKVFRTALESFRMIQVITMNFGGKYRSIDR
jgi:hypothetical protein